MGRWDADADPMIWKFVAKLNGSKFRPFVRSEKLAVDGSLKNTIVIIIFYALSPSLPAPAHIYITPPSPYFCKTIPKYPYSYLQDAQTISICHVLTSGNSIDSVFWGDHISRGWILCIFSFCACVGWFILFAGGGIWYSRGKSPKEIAGINTGLTTSATHWTHCAF